MKKIIFLSFIFLLFCTGCQNNPPISFIDFSKTTPITKNTTNNNDTKPLKIAVATVLSPNVTISNYRNIAKYISEKTNRPTLLIQRKTYEELNILMSNGEADIAFMSTGAYSSYRGLNEIELLAMVAYAPYWVGNDVTAYTAYPNAFTITATATCTAPYALTATGITASSANLGWSTFGTEVLWNVEYGVTGFVQGAGTTVSGVTNPYTLKNTKALN